MTSSVVRRANELKCRRIISGLEKRGMTGYYCENSREACEKVLSLIPNGSRVSWGGSATLEEIEVKDRLELVNAQIIDPQSISDPEEAYRARVNALNSDVFLTSTNAVTMEGELVNIDGSGNRTAAICFGPRRVVIVAGVNKIAADEKDAISRIKKDACPANCIRLGKETPCAVTGVCGDCMKVGQTICAMTLTTRFCNKPDRIHVVLVNEILGY